MYKKLKLTTISELIKNIYCSLSVIIIGCASAYAVEFNKDLIEAEDRENVNLSQFETDGQLPVGKYSLSTLINNKRTPIHLDLQWVLIDNLTAVCVTPEQLTLLGFTDEIIEEAQQNLIDGCYPIEKEKQITTYLDKGKMQLSISAPQAWLKYKDANWTPPELWDHGIAGAFLDYNLYASHYAPHQGDNSQNISSYGQAGVNLGAWRLRTDYQYDQSFNNGKSQANNLDFPRIYLFRPIPAINAKLTIGQYDTESSVFDSFHFSGVSLKSDENMLPLIYVVTHRKSRVLHKRMQRSLSHRTTVLFIKKTFLQAHFLLPIYSIHYRGNWTSRLKKRTGASRNGKLHLIAFLI